MSEFFRGTTKVQLDLDQNDLKTVVLIEVPFKEGTKVEVLVRPIVTSDDYLDDEQMYGQGGGFTLE